MSRIPPSGSASFNNDDSRPYVIRWRGRQEGPFEWDVIEAKLRAKQIGLLHEISRDGEWITLRAFLAEQKLEQQRQNQARLEQERREKEKQARKEEQQREEQETRRREEQEARRNEEQEARRREDREDRRREEMEDRRRDDRDDRGRQDRGSGGATDGVSGWAMTFCILVALFVPFGGFIAGGYLMSNGASGVGSVCIILNILSFLVYFG